ncbi:hypothetical protein ACWGID_14245 [Kribbella sp. NPDC054772]
METLIAYSFAHDSAARATAGRARVEAYYGDLWQHEAKHHGYDGSSVGLHLWDRRDGSCRWPSWHDAGDVCVASVHAPLGYQRVIGEIAPYDAPPRLAHAVRRTPASFLELASPFTMAVLDPADERLELFTDFIGVGRLFQLRLPDGWVWTNRPVAALLFAGVPAVASSRGWTFAAGCGWFMDDSTPYDSVLTVPGATHIVAEGYRQRPTVSRIETTSVLSTDVEETAAALQDVARSVGSLWQERPTVDLSGGPDSRLVASAFFAAGVDVDSQTTPSKQVRPQPLELVDRALRWHRYAEGLRPASDLFNTPPATLAGVTRLEIGSAGGEIAHGHFYPRDVLQIDALPLPAKLSAFGNHLQSRLMPAAGPADSARSAVADQIDRVLRTAVDGGIENATMLDYFYVVERLRRGGTTGDVVSPLLIPSFVRAAFALDPAQRIENALHRELVRLLVPERADFTPSPQVSTRRSPAKLRCLADAADRDLIEQVLADVDGFDSQALSTLWAASVAGASSATGESTLRQALWRATFDQHLAEVNRHVPARSPLIRAIAATKRAYRTSRFGPQ